MARCSTCQQIISRRAELDAAITGLNDDDDASRQRIAEIEAEIADLCQSVATMLQVPDDEKDDAWANKLHGLVEQIAGGKSEKVLVLARIVRNASRRSYMQGELVALNKKWFACTTCNK